MIQRQRAPISWFPQTLQQPITSIRQIETLVKSGTLSDRELDEVISELEDAVYEAKMALFTLESTIYSNDPNYPHGLIHQRAAKGLANYGQR